MITISPFVVEDGYNTCYIDSLLMALFYTQDNMHSFPFGASMLNNNPKKMLEQVFNFDECSLIRILYNLEILSSKISPLSNNIGIKISELFEVLEYKQINY